MLRSNVLAAVLARLVALVLHEEGVGAKSSITPMATPLWQDSLPSTRTPRPDNRCVCMGFAKMVPSKDTPEPVPLSPHRSWLCSCCTHACARVAYAKSAHACGHEMQFVLACSGHVTWRHAPRAPPCLVCTGVCTLDDRPDAKAHHKRSDDAGYQPDVGTSRANVPDGLHVARVRVFIAHCHIAASAHKHIHTWSNEQQGARKLHCKLARSKCCTLTYPASLAHHGCT